ncbi:uncharacterized protein LOC123534893 [Mercenaria mercenaria]|uniref:uncharacterized protein LOC123534893 n=1 Tax=Mercenaria mercenaria TaxID=6596 RepID=UPI001E1D23DF|nr:uncharacterized protein LOC123534893 [Mercenaria mercenaria]XP_045173289.1 uncharacterized protein LOC123534893 [Mercenaria mercenaria]XP_045173291.1 uncharacterized protein LOC123534893 [Mercenaria mercenaria]
MNGISGLPGIEALFRDHKRLASKLTSDELRAIRDYIEERIRQEQADINFRLYALQNDFDVTVRKSSETISDLYQEVNEKKEVIEHYKKSDEAISTVHKQREQRWEKKQELLVTEIEKLEGEATRSKTRLQHAEKDLEEKSNDIKTLEEKLEEANKAVETVEEAKLVLTERDETKKEVLKLKMEIDKRDRLVQHHERNIAALKNEIEEFNREKKMNEMKVTSVQDELRKQMKEVAEKCKKLSEIQFQLQMEKRQTEKLQKQLKQATEDVRNYKHMLESARPPLNANDPVVITMRKDLDIMDIRIRSLDIGVRLRMDEVKRVEDRSEDLKEDERLAHQMRSEIYHQGDTFLELTATELVKHLEFRQRMLQEELKYARDWEQPKRDADTLRSEIKAFMKQAAICKVTDLGERAAKQLQKIDLIMRGVSDTTKMPRIYRVSERSNADQRQKQKPASKPAFLSASTPIGAFDNSSLKTTSKRNRKRPEVNKVSTFRHPSLENHTDDSKIHYIDTVELDLSRVTPSIMSRRESQSDRMTMKSVSSTTIPAIYK